ncbi:MAG: hypothetical protein Sapg2KO_40640 [Saprospiraceae bacterium]
MIDFVEANPQEFETLLKLSVSDKQPFAWRAAWLLSNCMNENDERVKDYLPTIINVLRMVPDGQKRDLFNVLRKMELKEEYEGMVYDICISTWSKLDKMSSLRINALKLALKIMTKHPELHEEMSLLTQDYFLETLSPGIKNSVLKMMKTIDNG